MDELLISAPTADGPGNAVADAGELYIVFDAGSTTVATPIVDEPAIRSVELLPNSPNPFNPTTTFTFEAPVGARVSLTVYDALAWIPTGSFKVNASSRNAPASWAVRSPGR